MTTQSACQALASKEQRNAYHGSAPRVSLRELAALTALLLGLLMCAFPRTFFRGEMIAHRDFVAHLSPFEADDAQVDKTPTSTPRFDLFCQFYPDYILTRKALDRGEWPLWNSLECGGMPLLANGQSATLYPFRLIHAFVEPILATTIYIVLKLLLCGLMAYLCARGLGLQPLSGVFLAVAWMFGAYNFTYPFWPLADVAGWAPIVFLGVERTLAGRYRGGFVLTAAGASLMLLAGHPESAFMMGLGLGMYFLMRVIADRPTFRGFAIPAAVQSAAWTLALCVAAAQIAPLLEYLANSLTSGARTGSVRIAGNVNLAVLSAGWVPRLFGTGAESNVWGDWDKMVIATLYPGVAVWLAASLGLGRRDEERAANIRRICLGLASVFCILMAFGAPPFEWVRLLPVFSTSRPLYYLAFPLFALPLLAALEFDAWFSGAPARRIVRGPAALAVLFTAATALVYFLHKDAIAAAGMTRYVLNQIVLAAALAIGVVGLLSASRRFGRPRLFAGLLVALLAFDLLFAVRGPSRTTPRSAVLPDTPFTSFLQGLDPPGPVRTQRSFIPPGFLPNYGVEQFRGYDGLYPKRWPEFMSVVGAETIVPYEVIDDRFSDLSRLNPDGRLELLARFGHLSVFRNKQALPRAFLIPEVEVAPDAAAILEEYAESTFQPGHAAVIESPLERELPSPPEGALGEANVVQREGGRVTIEATASQDCVLVMLDAYYPGWNAWVDTQPARVFPVYYAFRGILFPAGKHTVELRYQPVSFRIGLALSILTWIGVACASILWLFRTRRIAA